MLKRMTTGSTRISNLRTQDFLMPGLRHAHTLQQLKSLNEYSPPGEYLIQITKNNENHFPINNRK